jgi:predicted metal-dependent enzyme (double-stranded beta helix superfamily)
VAESYTPTDLVRDAANLLEGHDPREVRDSIAELLRKLGEQPGILSSGHLTGIHASTATAEILADEPHGPAIMLARFPHEAPTPVHNHNTWGIVYVLNGRDRYERWERLDDGSDPATSRLRLAESRELSAGNIAYIGAPPDDIHRQQGIGGPAWELVLFGRNPLAGPRTYFDIETGEATYADPAPSQ